MNELAITYDLDETILPASAVPDSTFEPLFNAIRAASKGKINDKQLDKAFAEMKYLAIDVISENYGFTKAMDAAAKDVL